MASTPLEKDSYTQKSEEISDDSGEQKSSAKAGEDKSAPKTDGGKLPLNAANKEKKPHESFQNVATAMLTIATFAAGVTLNVLLKPGNGSPPAPAYEYLAYANALFAATLVGCAVIKITIELAASTLDIAKELKKKVDEKRGMDNMGEERGTDNKDEKEKWKESFKWLSDLLLDLLTENEHGYQLAKTILVLETGFVGAILFVAIFLVLYSTSLFLQVKGPLIVGSVLYGFLGVVALTLGLLSLWLDRELASDRAMIDVGKGVVFISLLLLLIVCLGCRTLWEIFWNTLKRKNNGENKKAPDKV